MNDQCRLCFKALFQNYVVTEGPMGDLRVSATGDEERRRKVERGGKQKGNVALQKCAYKMSFIST